MCDRVGQKMGQEGGSRVCHRMCQQSMRGCVKRVGQRVCDRVCQQSMRGCVTWKASIYPD